MSDVVITAVAGLVATTIAALGVPFLTASANRKADSRKVLESRRLALYVDLNRIAIREEGLLRSVADPYLGKRVDDDTLQMDPLTAQVRLLASQKVQNAWAHLLETREITVWNFGENYPEALDVGRGRDQGVPKSDPDWQNLFNAVAALLAMTRHEATTPHLSMRERLTTRFGPTTGR